MQFLKLSSALALSLLTACGADGTDTGEEQDATGAQTVSYAYTLVGPSSGVTTSSEQVQMKATDKLVISAKVNASVGNSLELTSGFLTTGSCVSCTYTSKYLGANGMTGAATDLTYTCTKPTADYCNLYLIEGYRGATTGLKKLTIKRTK